MNQIDIKKNYFELFDVPRQFELNVSELEQRYQQLQRQTHPDRFGRADQHSQRLAMQAASYVNAAYATLSDPLKRAAYLLECDGVNLQQQTRSMPADFLAEQIELRERLLDYAGDSTALRKLNDELQRMSSGLRAELAEHFAVGCHDKAIASLQKWQFFNKLKQQADDLLFELEQG